MSDKIATKDSLTGLATAINEQLDNILTDRLTLRLADGLGPMTYSTIADLCTALGITETQLDGLVNGRYMFIQTNGNIIYPLMWCQKGTVAQFGYYMSDDGTEIYAIDKSAKSIEVTMI